MPERVPLRELWQGPPIRISSGWKLTKGAHRAECELFAHELGWELRLTIDGELHLSEVCRSTDRVLDLQDEWKSKLLQKQWSVA